MYMYIDIYITHAQTKPKERNLLMTLLSELYYGLYSSIFHI